MTNNKKEFLQIMAREMKRLNITLTLSGTSKFSMLSIFENDVYDSKTVVGCFGNYKEFGYADILEVVEEEEITNG